MLFKKPIKTTEEDELFDLENEFKVHLIFTIKSLKINKTGKRVSLICDTLQEMKDTNKHPIVVIPIFNNPEYLVRLIDSLSPLCPYCSFCLVDDGSNEETALQINKLKKLNSKIEVYKNEENYGFTHSVNTILKKIVENDLKRNVVIINTDVEVPQNAVHEMDEILNESKQIASVTSLCDTPGTLAGTPFIQLGGKTEELHGQKLEFSNYKAKILSKFWNLERIPIPTCVGFFTGLGHSAIKDVGIFDDINFNRGYGEENDWSFRATRLNYVHFLTTTIIVHHKVGVSFGDQTSELSKNHSEILRSKYPEYPENLNSWERESRMEVLRFVLRQTLMFENTFLSFLRLLEKAKRVERPNKKICKLLNIMAKYYIFLHLKFLWQESINLVEGKNIQKNFRTLMNL